MSPPNHRNVPWLKESPATETFNHLVDEQMTGKVDPEIAPPSVRLHGRCFVCFGEIETTWPLQLLPGGYGGDITGQSQGGEIYVDVILTCNCGHRHPGAARNVLGCGRTFKIGVPCD